MNVNRRMIQTIDDAIVVAILSESRHIPLDATRRTGRLVGAIAVRRLRVGRFAANGWFAGVRPVCPRDAEQAAHIAGARQRLVAAADRLANAAQADFGDGLLLGCSAYGMRKCRVVDY